MLHFSAHLGYLFTEQSLIDRFAAARQAGFRAVEYPAPYSVPVARMRSILDGEGCGSCSLRFLSATWKRAEKAVQRFPGREEDFLASVATGLEYATAVGASFVHVLSGLIPAGADFGRFWDTYIRNLARAGEPAAQCGLNILIEPIAAASVASYFMDRSHLALARIDESPSPT